MDIITGNVFHFGRHDGRSVDYVIQKDPNYCVWLIKNDVLGNVGPLKEEFMAKWSEKHVFHGANVTAR